MNTLFEDSKEDALDRTGSSANLVDKENVVSSSRQTKRYRVFCELLETEQNYVDVLKCILEDYRDKFDQLNDSDREAMINKHQLHMLFGKVEPILEVHKGILAYLQRQEQEWNGKNKVGYTYAHSMDKFSKYYIPYINSYDEIMDNLNRLLQNPIACQFIRNCEATSVKKFTLKDLLIRLIQRLPSVVLLLTELQKATPKSYDDSPFLEIARKVVNDVLSKSNESRRDTDTHQQTLEISNSIENFPPDLIHSNRVFYSQADFHVIATNNSVFKKQKGSVLTFFLFNDIVVIAKRRDRMQSFYYPGQSRLSISQSMNTSVSDFSKLNRSGSVSTLKRSLSFLTTMKQDRKPFKFMVALCFSGFRELFYTKPDGLFYLKLRDDKSDEMTTVRVSGETTFEIAMDLLENLCDQINKTSRREVALIDATDALNNKGSFQDSFIHSDDLEYMAKTRKSAQRDYIKPTLRLNTLKRLN